MIPAEDRQIPQAPSQEALIVRALKFSTCIESTSNEHHTWRRRSPRLGARRPPSGPPAVPPTMRRPLGRTRSFRGRSVEPAREGSSVRAHSVRPADHAGGGRGHGRPSRVVGRSRLPVTVGVDLGGTKVLAARRRRRRPGAGRAPDSRRPRGPPTWCPGSPTSPGRWPPRPQPPVPRRRAPSGWAWRRWSRSTDALVFAPNVEGIDGLSLRDALVERRVVGGGRRQRRQRRGVGRGRARGGPGVRRGPRRHPRHGGRRWDRDRWAPVARRPRVRRRDRPLHRRPRRALVRLRPTRPLGGARLREPPSVGWDGRGGGGHGGAAC